MPVFVNPKRLRPTERMALNNRVAFFAALAKALADAALRRACQVRTTQHGRPATLNRADLITALLFHFMSRSGTFAQHLLSLTGMSKSDGTLAERRAAPPWEVFRRLMAVALKPRAQQKRHPRAFFGGLRLLAIDGTQWSLVTTPQNLTLGKARTKRGGHAGFAKLTSVVLVELGLHNPVAAQLGRQGQSE